MAKSRQNFKLSLDRENHSNEVMTLQFPLWLGEGSNHQIKTDNLCIDGKNPMKNEIKYTVSQEQLFLFKSALRTQKLTDFQKFFSGRSLML